VGYYLALPFVFLKFWYIEAPLGLIKFFGSLNTSILHFFSFSILIKTFFKPIKNEYRKGLVGFSIGMGIFAKTILILLSLIILFIFLIFEVLFVILFLTFPFLTLSFLMI